MEKALLVIDMQEIYVGKNHHPYFQYEDTAIVEKVNRVISEYNADTVIYIQNVTGKGFIDKFAPFKAYEGMPETALVQGLNKVSEENIVKWKADAFSNPDLDRRLKQMGVKEVICIGVDGGACVPMTAMGAMKNGYDVTIRIDAIATINEKAQSKWMKKLQKAGAKIV